MKPLLIAIFAAAIGAGQSPSIVGTWRGTSTCIDKQHFPGCNDEQAVYEIRSGTRDTVIVKAQKIVNGAIELVSEDPFTRQADGSWRTDITTPRFQVRVVLNVRGDSIVGSLTDVGAGRKVRQIALRRDRTGR